AGPPQRVECLSPGRVHFGFTGSEELRGKLERVRKLMWHIDPSGRLEGVIERLAEFYLARRDPARRKRARGARKSAAKEAPPGAPPAARRTRRVPQAVKDAVWARDGGRCAFVAADGRRCEATEALEFDHAQPWARGGRSDAEDNIRLLCRSHNQWAAREMGLGRTETESDARPP
ncbi:MAG: HNH endonuclease, partial [Elusimicrobia bacterium]|nr:HNH endonuclease [Elusimicrobiota bacterium]